MRVVAILASYNEERFIEVCLRHYSDQGVEVYLLDNESTDGTVDIARRYLGENLIGIETLPRKGVFSLGEQLRRKERIADALKADWFIHADPDEIRIPADPGKTLVEAIADVDRQGYNAINFMEYTFLPTRESPDHDHSGFQETMRWYYPFLPRDPHRRNAWKSQPKRFQGLKRSVREVLNNRRLPPSVDLCSSGGHVVAFDGLRQYPEDFIMKHYLVLSHEHAVDKYVRKAFDPKETGGAHGWRATARESDFELPSESEMRLFVSNEELDRTNPRTEHILVRR